MAQLIKARTGVRFEDLIAHNNGLNTAREKKNGKFLHSEEALRLQNVNLWETLVKNGYNGELEPAPVVTFIEGSKVRMTIEVTEYMQRKERESRKPRVNAPVNPFAAE